MNTNTVNNNTANNNSDMNNIVITIHSEDQHNQIHNSLEYVMERPEDAVLSVAKGERRKSEDELLRLTPTEFHLSPSPAARSKIRFLT